MESINWRLSRLTRAYGVRLALQEISVGSSETFSQTRMEGFHPRPVK